MNVIGRGRPRRAAHRAGEPAAARRGACAGDGVGRPHAARHGSRARTTAAAPGERDSHESRHARRSNGSV